jgi:ubiquinone/menaquinone biosynthesis C-methylase UbiE
MTQTETHKGYKGMGMEGAAARWYASTTLKSIDHFRALARRIADELPRGRRVLEVAPGPGYFAIELAKIGGYRITGLDISRTFVEIASRNAAAAGVPVDFQRGDASQMPFDDESFDFLLCRAAFKNFARPVAALKEMHRVLAPGGGALIIDLRRNASRRSLDEAVGQMRLGPVNTFVTKLIFRHLLLKRAYTKEAFEQMAARTPFRSVEILEDRIGLEVSLQR